MTSPEHQFLAQAIDRAIQRIAQTNFLGVMEADRKKYDYACRLSRDLDRPLVSQVLWKNDAGVDKDIRSLLFSGRARIKIYLMRDTVRHRLAVDEVMEDFSASAEFVANAAGLRIIPFPKDFDADDETHRNLMEKYVHERIVKDVLFNIAFGNLRARHLKVFADHGNPLGLKLLILNEVSLRGLEGVSCLKRRGVVRSETPARECLSMLTGAGLVKNISGTGAYIPTIRGRAFLDFARKVICDAKAGQWSQDLRLITNELKMKLPEGHIRIDENTSDPIYDILQGYEYAKGNYGVDILAGIDPISPRFFSDFRWRDYKDVLPPECDVQVFDDPDSLFYVSEE